MHDLLCSLFVTGSVGVFGTGLDFTFGHLSLKNLLDAYLES